MPIETDIPIEIETYRKKIIFGLTGRQLICGVAALALSIGLYFLCTRRLSLNDEITGWIIMAADVPLLAVGFVRFQGMPFEEFLSLQIRRCTWMRRLPYETETEFYCETETKKERSESVGDQKSAGKDDTACPASECSVRYVGSARESRSHRRAASQRIKDAAKESRTAKRAAKRAEKRASRA